MNTVDCKHIEYLKNTQTIETIEVKSRAGRKLFYVYNYEGISYTCFESIHDLMAFFEGRFEPEKCFHDEAELDQYLTTLNL